LINKKYGTKRFGKAEISDGLRPTVDASIGNQDVKITGAL
jgi:hypothetical protein